MATNILVNRGVEAKEIEIANTRLELDTSEMSRHGTDSSATPAYSDQTASYVQVIVQKQRRGRLPAASSPVANVPAPHQKRVVVQGQGPAGEEAGGGAGALPATVLLAYPTLAALQSAYGGVARDLEMGVNNFNIPENDKTKEARRNKDGKNDGEVAKTPIDQQNYSSSDDESEAVEVLRLERAGAALAVRGVRGRGGRAERAARRVRRRAGRLLRAALAFPRLLLDLPVDLLLHLERCVLETVRALAVGGAGAAAEALGKPALAAAHNAAAAALAAAAGLARGVREALRPLAATLGDALEPLTRAAAALRLVHLETVHVHCAHPAAHCAHRAQPDSSGMLIEYI